MGTVLDVVDTNKETTMVRPYIDLRTRTKVESNSVNSEIVKEVDDIYIRYTEYWKVRVRCLW